MKNPNYADTRYVTDLVAANTVNTMPAKTLTAVLDHGAIEGDAVTGRYDDAVAALDAIDALGISYGDVTTLLERQGVEKFEDAWLALLADVGAALDAARR